MKDAAQALTPGNAGLFLLIRKMTTDKVWRIWRAWAAR
jgi:uncharacterized membrane protein